MKPHLFVSSTDGALYDTRDSNWSRNAPLRETFERCFRNVKTAAQFKATLRHGAYAWPGGYPLYFIRDDGGAICFDCGRSELRNILPAISEKARDGWRVIATDINYEDSELSCDHCSKPIQSAYGDSHGV